MQKYLPDPAATETFGAELFKLIPQGSVIFLNGNLGAGKTALVRGYLRAAGHIGSVKSPTYNIVETYQLAFGKVYHFDLYRLNDPEELEWLGMGDYFDGASTVFIEWPEKGEGLLPDPDMVIRLDWQGEGRLLELRNCQQKC